MVEKWGLQNPASNLLSQFDSAGNHDSPEVEQALSVAEFNVMVPPSLMDFKKQKYLDKLGPYG
jgi:hypothetical protein